MEVVRKHYQIYGAVQGVGFRWRAEHAAALLGVTGWARNDWDGSVEMEAQGTEEQLRQLLLLIRRGTFVSIEQVEERSVPTDDDERGFHVR